MRKSQDTCNVVIFRGFFLFGEVTNDMTTGRISYDLYHVLVKDKRVEGEVYHNIVHKWCHIVVQSLTGNNNEIRVIDDKDG